MFRSVIIDNSPTEPFSVSAKRLLSIFHLLSDDVLTADRVYIGTTVEQPDLWTPPISIDGNWCPQFAYPSYADARKLFGPRHIVGTNANQRADGSGVYDIQYRWIPKGNEPPELWRNEILEFSNAAYYYDGFGETRFKCDPGGIVFSRQKWVRDVSLRESGLAAQTSILLLAAAGIELFLPNTTIDNTHPEELHKTKYILAEEREEYLRAVTKLADQSFARLVAGNYRDAIDWARNEAIFKVKPAADRLESNLLKLDKPLIERLGVGFVREGIPAIGQAYIEHGVGKAARVAGEQILRALCASLAQKLEERRAPEANYGLKLSKALRSAS